MKRFQNGFRSVLTGTKITIDPAFPGHLGVVSGFAIE